MPGAPPTCLRDLYAELDEALTAWGEVEVAPLMHYIAYRGLSAARPEDQDRQPITVPYVRFHRLG